MTKKNNENKFKLPDKSTSVSIIWKKDKYDN